MTATNYLVHLCLGPNCTLAGSRTLLHVLEEEIAALGIGDHVVLLPSTCRNRCDWAPSMNVMPGDVRYNDLDADAIRRIAREHFAGGPSSRNIATTRRRPSPRRMAAAASPSTQTPSVRGTSSGEVVEVRGSRYRSSRSSRTDLPRTSNLLPLRLADDRVQLRGGFLAGLHVADDAALVHGHQRRIGGDPVGGCGLAAVLIGREGQAELLLEVLDIVRRLAVPTPMKTTCKSGFAAAISLICGASAWQCGHHEAKKTIRVGLPRIFAFVRVEPSLAMTLKSGAAAPATGEATGGGRTFVEAVLRAPVHARPRG